MPDEKPDRFGVQDPKAVFVVYGRNEPAHRAVLSYLRSIGLSPIQWSDAVASTGKGAPFVGEILQRGLDHAQAVVVLLTGDDVARVRHRYKKDGEQDGLEFQPRANVIFEAGMALGRFPDRTIFVQIGEIRCFSDLAGRHYIHLDGSQESTAAFLNRLQGVGCSVHENARNVAFPNLPALSEGKPDGTVEFGKKTLVAAVAVCVLLSFLAGLVARPWFESSDLVLEGEVQGQGAVSIFLVGGQYVKNSSGTFTMRTPLGREAQYKVLYVVENQIVKDEALSRSTGMVRLGRFDNQMDRAASAAILPALLVSNEKAERFLNEK